MVPARRRARAKIPGCAPALRRYVRAMDWQQIVSLLIVASAAALMIRSRVQRRRFQFGRDTHCGCSSPATTASRSSMIFMARKGEPTRIVIKMK